MTRHFSMIRDFHLADLFTLLNGACGTAAIFFAMSHIAERSDAKTYAAGIFVVFALVFDVLDGRVARWRHTASPMGRELDSLADVISFGVAPAILSFAWGLSSLGRLAACFVRFRLIQIKVRSGGRGCRITSWSIRLRPEGHAEGGSGQVGSRKN